MTTPKTKKRNRVKGRVKGFASRHGESVQRRTRGFGIGGVKTLRITRLAR